MAVAKFHELKISTVHHETADAVVIDFEISKSLKSAFAFEPGQYLTLRAEIDGQSVRRSYSICSPVSEKHISVGVKRIEGGTFSAFAQTLQPGQILDVMTPQGRFTKRNPDEANFLLLAAGSGITPMVSIATSVLSAQPTAQVNLCYANRNSSGIMFKDAFDDLKDSYFTRFQVTHLLDEEYQDIDLFNGRIDGEKLSTLATANIIDPLAYDAVFICGPEPMIKAAAKALETLGVEKDKIRFELFTPAGGNPVASDKQTNKPEQTKNANTSEITFMLDGVTRRFELVPGTPLIEAVEAAGFEIPYSCNNGMCATCRCKLVNGKASMKQNFSLEPWEQDAGFVLACQLEPETDKIVLDFDAI